MKLTAIIRKGMDGYFVALCQEVDVVSQGKTVDEALSNLKEAVELYIEEVGFPKNASANKTIVTDFEVVVNAKASSHVRA